MKKNKIKRIAVFTTGRQDWGILRSPVMHMIKSAEFKVDIIAGGMACDSKFGDLCSQICSEGFKITGKLEWKTGSGSNLCGEAASAMMMAQDEMVKIKPDAIMLLGDRFETLAIAFAASILKIPIIHLHGGEETLGAIDNQFRNAITKLSHIHFVSNELYARRVIQMGEQPDLVFVTGAPGLDNMHRKDIPPIAEILKSLNLKRHRNEPIFLLTYHPPTLIGDIRKELNAIISALEDKEGICICTMPNNEPGSVEIRKDIEAFVKRNPQKRAAVSALGEKRYWSVLKNASLVIGNSSSGVIEAPAIPVPVINIGTRQKGRLSSRFVINIENPDSGEISKSIDSILSGSFAKSKYNYSSPYGDGRAGVRICKILKKINFQNLIVKKFYDLPFKFNLKKGTTK